MTTQTQHPLVSRYLKNLDRALRDVPADRRREIVEDIKGHIAEAAAARGEEMTEAELRELLDEVGHPEAIADETRDRLGIPHKKAGAMEAIAIGALLFGGLIVPFVGWILGAALLWASSAWTTRQKVLGTLVVPGGLAAPLFLGWLVAARETCVVSPDGRSCERTVTTYGGEALLIGLAIASVAVAIYLARKAFARS